MTDLTEQWKKGELLEGFYYVKCDWSDEVEIRYVHNGVDDWKEIIAEVPSYDEWKRILHYARKYEFEYTSCAMDYENLKEENTKLKELLKECQSKLNYCTRETYELQTKISQVLGEDK